MPHSPALVDELAAARRCRLLAASWAAAAGEAVLAWDLVERVVEGLLVDYRGAEVWEPENACRGA